MSSKRPREENAYSSRETSRRKYERSHHESSYHDRSNNRHHERNHIERDHNRNDDRSHSRKHDRYYEDDRKTERKLERNSEVDREQNEKRRQQFEQRKKLEQPNLNTKSTFPPENSASIPTNPASNSTESTAEKPIIKEKVNFNKSGKLAEDTNMQNGVIVKYSEPIEAAKPNKNWRLYPFKNDESLPFIPVHKKSHYLLGRDRKVVDIALDHPSISKQHAVIQFRMIESERKDGGKFKEIRPYLMDLESSNKTYLNNKEIEPHRYYQMLEKDVLKFGFSSREYVCLIDHDEETK